MEEVELKVRESYGLIPGSGKDEAKENEAGEAKVEEKTEE